jgi:hypothetical protein
MTTTTGMTASPNSRLLDNSRLMRVVQEQRKQRSPEEEYRLHDTNCEGGFQHSASLVDVQRERIICVLAVGPERTQRDPNGAAMPAGTVCVGDEAELVDGCNEGAEEEQVHECDETCGSLCCREAD